MYKRRRFAACSQRTRLVIAWLKSAPDVNKITSASSGSMTQTGSWSTPSSKTLVSRKRVATSHKLKKLRKSLFWQWTQMKSYKADFERDVWFNRPDIRSPWICKFTNDSYMLIPLRGETWCSPQLAGKICAYVGIWSWPKWAGKKKSHVGQWNSTLCYFCREERRIN